MRFLSNALLGCGLLVVLPLQTQKLAHAFFHPPGRLLGVGGRRTASRLPGAWKLNGHLRGGGNAYATDSTIAQPLAIRETRVCSYDRAGLGWSDSELGDETVEQTIADLHALLRAANGHPPYILVGASVGGAFILAYQRAHPKEIAGLVFSNSANHIGINARGRSGLIWNLTEDEIRSAYPLPASAKGPEPSHEGEPFDRLPPRVQAARLWLDQRHWKHFNPATVSPEGTLSWRNEFLREFEDVARSASPVLGTLPVIVISSNPIFKKSECLMRNTAAACLDFLSSNTVHITALKSGHEIHLSQPNVVVQALFQAVWSVRQGKPLTEAGRSN